MAMLKSYTGLLEGEGTRIDSKVAYKTPKQYVSQNGFRNEGKCLIFVRLIYQKGESPLMRKIAPYFGRQGKQPWLISKGLGIGQDGTHTRFNKQGEGGSGFVGFLNDAEPAYSRIWLEKPIHLPKNGKISQHSSIWVVQFGEEIRVYGDQELPSELVAAKTALDSENFLNYLPVN